MNGRKDMKAPKIEKDRELQSGRKVSQFAKEIKMTISSQCPDKWLFVDLETGDVWHRREEEFDNDHYTFWRSATPKELRELRKLET
jgi:hypothetical protein